HPALADDRRQVSMAAGSDRVAERGAEIDVLIEVEAGKIEIFGLIGGRDEPVRGQRVQFRVAVAGHAASRIVTAIAPVSSMMNPPAFSATAHRASGTCLGPASP